MVLEDRFIYRPLRVGRLVGMGSDVSIQTSDGETLHGRYLAQAYAWFNILYLHGSRGNLATRAGVLQYFSARGANVLGVDYRGYGQSTGRPSEEGLYQDAVAAYAWLTNHVPAESVVVIGEGLGSAPACRLAAAHSCSGLVLLSAFTNLRELAAARYPWMPTQWIVRSSFDNLLTLPAVRVPSLIVHSRADEKVPFDMGTRLFEVAGSPKQSLWLDDARHDEVFSVSGEHLALGLTSYFASLEVPG